MYSRNKQEKQNSTLFFLSQAFNSLTEPAGRQLRRNDLGLPDSWGEVESWIDDSRDVAASINLTSQKPTVKNPEICVLTDYAGPAPPGFWKKFPSYYPKTIVSSVEIGKLENLIADCWDSWTLSQKLTARKTIERLKGKRPVKLKKRLDPLFEKIAKSALENGQAMTDVLATWIKKRFVAGPFEKPPCEGFRANPLMAAVQRTKIRPIMNLSAPKGLSFNDAVDETSVDLLKMSSAKIFAEALVHNREREQYLGKKTFRMLINLSRTLRNNGTCTVSNGWENIFTILRRFLEAKRHRPASILCQKP
jgi:hypothetical protein